MEDVQISRNFKLSEFIYSETALEKGIDNTPNEQEQRINQQNLLKNE